MVGATTEDASRHKKNATVADDKISVTGILAIYGAALSSVGFGWNLYRDLLDKARVKVTAHIRRIVIPAWGRPVVRCFTRLASGGGK
jgi:hypothetical protein